MKHISNMDWQRECACNTEGNMEWQREGAYNTKSNMDWQRESLVKKSCLNRDSNPGSLAHRASALTTELSRHMDQLTTFTIYNLYRVTYTPTILKFVLEFSGGVTSGLLSDYFNFSVGDNELTDTDLPHIWVLM